MGIEDTTADVCVTSCEQILRSNSTLWEQAVHHPFLEGCQAGTISRSAFNAWLEQDHLFVTEFQSFAAQVLSEAPEEGKAALQGGVSALEDELNWMKAKLKERSLNESASQHSVTQQYCKLMQQLQGKPYAVLAAAFWAIEHVYNQAWALDDVAPEYKEFADRWGNADFSKYVTLLQQQADRALATAAEDARQQAVQIAGVDIPKLEIDFWNMAISRAMQLRVMWRR